jgi:PqqD family protein of HPr-rel-A system
MTQPVVERSFQRCAISSHHWACWDDEYVVFDEASGQTHLLDPIKAYILDVLSDGFADVSRLRLLVEQASSVPAHMNSHEVVLAALEQLERSQLIEMVPL